MGQASQEVAVNPGRAVALTAQRRPQVAYASGARFIRVWSLCIGSGAWSVSIKASSCVKDSRQRTCPLFGKAQEGTKRHHNLCRIQQVMHPASIL